MMVKEVTRPPGRDNEKYALPAGFRKSNAGLIPRDWIVKTIGETLRLDNGFAFKPGDWTDRGLPIIRIQNLNDVDSSFNYYDATLPDRYHVTYGDLLFAWSGTTGTSFGARIWEGPNGVLNQHIFKVTPNRAVLTPQYALLVLQRVQNAITKQAHGFKSSFVHVKKSDLVGIPLPIPPLAEQRAIAAALSDVDELIGALEKLIAKKRAIKLATMQQLLTGKTRLPGFSGKWGTIKMGSIGTTYGGLSGKAKADFGHGGTRYVTFLNVLENVEVDHSLLEHVDVRPGESQNAVREGDILFNGTSETPGDLAMGCVVPTALSDVYLNSFCFGFRLQDLKMHSPRFLAYTFRSDVGRSLMFALAQGATRYNMSKRQFLNLELQLPDVDEQREIVSVLSDMDAEITALEQRRDKTKAIKQGMMQQLLTGKIRLVPTETGA